MTVETHENLPSVPAKPKSRDPVALASPFEVLDKYQTFQDIHQKTWWEKTGLLLSKVLVSANYSLARQYEALIFYREVLLPLMGPNPQTFRSAITRSGLPVEFSVNYQQRGETEPVVRIGFEPVLAASGTDEDLYNQKPVSLLLEQLERLNIPGFDASLLEHFLERHTVSASERAKLTQNKMVGSDLTSQYAFGFDLKLGAMSVKGYTFPALKCHASGRDFGVVIADSVNSIKDQIGSFPSFDMVNDYMKETDGYSQFAFWSWDCVKPTSSRLKLYSSNNDVFWPKIEEIWTLGGRVDTPTVRKGLEYLSQLWSFTKVAEGRRDFTGGFDDGKDSTPTPMVWNYEMQLGNPIPLTKFYFPIHGENDQKIIRGIAQFLIDIGLTTLGESYEKTVQDYL
jgi:DMATS type aromatic prenyltransferase